MACRLTARILAPRGGPCQRMTTQRLIDGDEPHVFRGALSEKKPVERITRRRFWIERPHGMAVHDREEI